MKAGTTILLAAFAMPNLANAADYIIDLELVVDFEDLRPLIEGCQDIGELESYRSSLESVSDLEDLRDFLEALGRAYVSDCPDVEATGITRLGD